MNNKPVSGDLPEEKQEKRNAGWFAPGQSGNPAGRPKMTKEEKDALEELKMLAPKAVDEISKILGNEKASLYAKIQVIDIILNRTYGRPETSLKLETAQQSVETSAERIDRLVEKIREERRMKQ